MTFTHLGNQDNLHKLKQINKSHIFIFVYIEYIYIYFFFFLFFFIKEAKKYYNSIINVAS